MLRVNRNPATVVLDACAAAALALLLMFSAGFYFTHVRHRQALTRELARQLDADAECSNTRYHHIQELAAQGADVRVSSPNGYTVLSWGLSLTDGANPANRTQAREWVLHGANPDSPDLWGDTVLIQAAKDGDLEMAGLLLDRGAHVNAHGRTGRTPLEMADGHPAMLRLLLARGADPNQADFEGWVPLMSAAHDRSASNLQVLRLLLAHGANPNAADKAGWTALTVACLFHFPEAAEALLEAGARVNARDFWGKTPLFRAASSGDAATVRRLLQWGADPRIRDQAGLCAANWAHGPEVRALLQKATRPTLHAASTSASNRGNLLRRADLSP